MRKEFLLLIILGICTACTPKLYMEPQSHQLSSISIVSRDGLSETINNTERLNQYDNVDFLQNQPYEKVLRVWGRDAAGDIYACMTTYHPNGQVKQYLDIVNNNAMGSYREWYESGIQKVEAQLVGGEADLGTTAEKSWLFDGCSTAWDDEGRLQATIQYFRGELYGNALYYHTDGSIWKSLYYVHGWIEGPADTYTSNGHLLQRTHYHHGKKEGASKRYWNDEQLSSDELYVDGALKEGTYYDKNGKILSEISNGYGYRALFAKEGVCELQQYQEGYLDGIVKVFGPKGLLLHQYHMKNGLKHGEEVEYYATQSSKSPHQPLLSLQWYEGRIQGIVRTWYENGVLESQREMTANSKNGISTGWYNDGSLMLIEEYENDKLMKGEYFSQGEKYPISTIHDGKGIATLYDSEGNFLQKVTYQSGYPAT